MTINNYKHKYLNEKISIHNQTLAKSLKEINNRKSYINRMIISTVDLNDKYDSKRHDILKVIFKKRQW